MRLATFNVHHGAPASGLSRVSATVREIVGFRPDVLAVQEVERRVPRSWWADQTVRIARSLGHHHVFAPTLRYGPFGALGTAGNALTSRWPLTEVEFVTLPARGRETRIATIATTGPEDAPFTCACTHLVNDDVDGARLQLVALFDALRDRSRPCVVMGDLNLAPKDCLDLFDAAGFATVQAGPTSPAASPRRMLDWIAYDGLGLLDAFVPDTQVSDHRPVVASFGAAPLV